MFELAILDLLWMNHRTIDVSFLIFLVTPDLKILSADCKNEPEWIRFGQLGLVPSVLFLWPVRVCCGVLASGPVLWQISSKRIPPEDKSKRRTQTTSETEEVRRPFGARRGGAGGQLPGPSHSSKKWLGGKRGEAIAIDLSTEVFLICL